jgi:hypothetical protein
MYQKHGLWHCTLLAHPPIQPARSNLVCLLTHRVVNDVLGLGSLQTAWTMLHRFRRAMLHSAHGLAMEILQHENSKPVLMSHRARSHQPTLDAYFFMKDREYEHPQRSEERRCPRRLEHRPKMAQVSSIADQRGDGSRLDRYLSTIVLAVVVPTFPTTGVGTQRGRARHRTDSVPQRWVASASNAGGRSCTLIETWS